MLRQPPRSGPLPDRAGVQAGHALALERNDRARLRRKADCQVLRQAVRGHRPGAAVMSGAKAKKAPAPPARSGWLARYRRQSRETLELALNEVPGYAEWRQFDPGPRAGVDERYAALPALTKRELREHFPAGFVPRQRELGPGLAAGEVEFAQTSGSTDDRVTLVFNPAWWEESERAAWDLNRHARLAADGRHREAVLASPRCVGPGYSARPLSVAERTIGRHLYVNQKINPATWSDGDVRRMAHEINGYEPVTLEGDPAYLAAFARRIVESGIEVFSAARDLSYVFFSFPCLPAPDRRGFFGPAHQFLWLDRDRPRIHGVRGRAPASEQRALPGGFPPLALPPRRPQARAHPGHRVP